MPVALPPRWTGPIFPVFAVAVTAMILFCGASAEEQPSEALAPVVVTATRLPTPESEVASSITVISREEIEGKQERAMPRVLQDVPGLNVVQTGGVGGQTSVFIRGTNSNQTKVFLDGIDVT